MAHRRALEYFGGVPERWIIDNLKAGVDKPDREEPRLNPSFREFAKHHNVAVLPARSGQPTDKAKVEAAVGAIQTRILLVLRHEIFFSLETMNGAIRRELDRLNEAPMACGESRRAIFEANERDHLQPLPANPWEWGEWLPRKVGPNGHVRVERKRRRARLTRRQLWIEYRDEALARSGTAYSYSQFCARLKARLKDRAGETEIREIPHQAGQRQLCPPHSSPDHELRHRLRACRNRSDAEHPTQSPAKADPAPVPRGGRPASPGAGRACGQGQSPAGRHHPASASDRAPQGRDRGAALVGNRG